MAVMFEVLLGSYPNVAILGGALAADDGQRILERLTAENWTSFEPVALDCTRMSGLDEGGEQAFRDLAKSVYDDGGGGITVFYSTDSEAYEQLNASGIMREQGPSISWRETDVTETPRPDPSPIPEV